MGELNYNLPEKAEARSASDGKIKTALSSIKETINGKLEAVNLASAAVTEAKLGSEAVATGKIKNEAVTSAKLATGLGRIQWYTPKYIATEQKLTSASFKLMSENGEGGTADQIENVVLAENGLLLIGYSAHFKSSGIATGRAAPFLGSNQLKSTGLTTNEAETVSTEWRDVVSTGGGLKTITEVGEPSPDVTTGQILGKLTSEVSIYGGFMVVFAEKGTYTVSIKYKATSGSVTAKERKLWVASLG